MKDRNGFELKVGDKVKLVNLVDYNVWLNQICLVTGVEKQRVHLRRQDGEEGTTVDSKILELYVEEPDDDSQFEEGFDLDEGRNPQYKFSSHTINKKIKIYKNSNKFKVGDEIICKQGVPFRLEPGRIYIVDDVNSDGIKVQGINHYWNPKRFELVEKDDDKDFGPNFDLDEKKIYEATLTKEEIREKDIYFNAANARDILHKYLDIFPTNKIFNARFYSEVDYKIGEPNDKHPHGVIIYKDNLLTAINRITNDIVRKELIQNIESKNYKVINLFQDKLDGGRFTYNVVGQEVRLDNKHIRHREKVKIIILRSDDQYYILVADTKKDLNSIAKYRQVRSEDWEKLVALAWNFNKEEYDKFMINKRKKDQYYLNLGNRTNVSEGDARKFDPHDDKLNELYVKVADNIVKQLKVKISEISSEYTNYIMVYNGSRNQDRPTREWQQYGSKSTMPKTDIFLRENYVEQPVMKISMKKKGASQLLSSSQSDIKALFNTVYKRMSDEDKTTLGININRLFDDEKWAKYTTTKNITDIKKNFYDLNKDWDTLSDEEKKIRISNISNKETKKVMSSVLDHHELNDIIQDYINSRKFKNAIVKEALTGEYKFGLSSKSSADWILTFGASETDKIEFYKISDSLIEEISENVGFNISFKSSGKSKMTVLRMTHGRMESLNPNDYGINQLLLEAFEEKTLLNEEFLDIFKSGYDKFMMWILNFYEKLKEIAKDILQKSIDEFLTLFGLESQIEIKKDYTF